MRVDARVVSMSVLIAFVVGLVCGVLLVWGCATSGYKLLPDEPEADQ